MLAFMRSRVRGPARDAMSLRDGAATSPVPSGGRDRLQRFLRGIPLLRKRMSRRARTILNAYVALTFVSLIITGILVLGGVQWGSIRVLTTLGVREVRPWVGYGVNYTNVLDPLDKRTAQPFPTFADIARQYEAGEYEPEEPERLPGLRITRRTFTPAELLEKFGDMDIVYSFVNGTEVSRYFRKVVVLFCHSTFLRAERDAYHGGGVPPAWLAALVVNNTVPCLPPILKGLPTGTLTGASLRQVLQEKVAPDIGDRETDELRHSLRSVEQHVQWHRGRVVMVSPGHHPTWVDGAKNFLSGMCGDAAVQEMRRTGTHLRVTTVHQDALMPYGMRLTANSHSIEQHLWRVRNITAAHVYMNDDYFVNRDVAITDLFNEYGGTIVRTEKGILQNGTRATPRSASWVEGVRHTHLFNIVELDLRHEDELPRNLEFQWSGAVGGVPPVALSDAVDLGYAHTLPSLPASVAPRRHRRYATHAPFVYCTNMHRFLQTRYAADFAFNALHHRTRSAEDYYIPFVYNAFIMARPWQASPKFLPYLLELQQSRRAAVPGAAPAPSAEIALDNFDGCGPASLRGGVAASECVFAKFHDETTKNDPVLHRIREVQPLFFNINTAFGSPAATQQLVTFLHDKFPTPVYLERATAAGLEISGRGLGEDPGGSGTLAGVFDALMALPVVGLVSDEEGACPLVRSLALAFAGHHRGPVHLGIARGEAGALRARRAALRHRVVSAMPAAACAYGSAVTMGNCSADESAAAVAARVLGDGGASGVVLPSTCGGAGGGGSAARGMRVRGFVVDARTPGGLPVRSAAALREALAVPAQTLALEDFRAVRVGPAADDVVLVLSRGDAAAAAVHWVAGASESDLLVTYPLPVAQYENMSAPVRWSAP